MCIIGYGLRPRTVSRKIHRPGVLHSRAHRWRKGTLDAPTEPAILSDCPPTGGHRGDRTRVPHPEASGPGRSEVDYEYRIELSRASRKSADLDGGSARRSTPGFLFFGPDRVGGSAGRGAKAL